jgi:DSF synthase
MLKTTEKKMPYAALKPVSNANDHREARTARRILPDAASHAVTLSAAPPLDNLFSFETCQSHREWRLDELDVAFEPDEAVLWQYMRPKARPSFTNGLLRDMNQVADAIEAAFAQASQAPLPMRFVVTASRLFNIFNLGGDLNLFLKLIEMRNRDGLRRYAHACARGQYRLHSSFDVPVCMIALVQGDALGGGFEAALAHDVIIAERQANFGLPEVLFNMFPGMGAYSFLARRIGSAQAERMILSGKVYTAEELHALGLIERLVDPGQGIQAVQEFIAMFNQTRHSRQAVLKTRKIVERVSIEELIDIADVWVDTALQLSAQDLRRMSHLARAQDRRWSKLAASAAPIAAQA